MTDQPQGRHIGQFMAKQKPLLAGIVIGSIGGFVFFLMGMPLPWMLGSMLFTSTAALAGVSIALPRAVRNAFIPALGVSLGGFFDPSTMASVATLALLGGLVLLYMLITVGVGFLFFNRLAGYDRVTSCFAAVPGGLSEIVMLAEPLKADVKVIALVHAARLVVAVPLITFGLRMYFGIDPDAMTQSGVPGLRGQDVAILSGCAIAGYVLAKRLRIPAPQLFGPLILSVTAHSFGLVEGAPPGWLIATAQILIGLFIGARFTGVILSEVYPVMLWSAAWAGALLVLVGGLAYPVSLYLAEPYNTLLLAFAPGGVAEISVLALSAGATLSIVLTVQFLRLGATMVFGAIVAGWIQRRRDAGN